MKSFTNSLNFNPNPEQIFQNELQVQLQKFIDCLNYGRKLLCVTMVF